MLSLGRSTRSNMNISIEYNVETLIITFSLPSLNLPRFKSKIFLVFFTPKHPSFMYAGFKALTEVKIHNVIARIRLWFCTVVG